jgi:hypothetical protein
VLCWPGKAGKKSTHVIRVFDPAGTYPNLSGSGRIPDRVESNVKDDFTPGTDVAPFQEGVVVSVFEPR